MGKGQYANHLQKMLQLEKQGYVKSRLMKNGKMPEKAIYSLTAKGQTEFEKLMLGIAARPINIYLILMRSF